MDQLQDTPAAATEDKEANVMKSERLDAEKRQRIMESLYLYYDGYSKEEYEQRWNGLKQRYRKIRVFRMKENIIGELIPRVTGFINEEADEADTLTVLLPEMEDGEMRICSRALISLLNQKIYFPIGEDILFWAYVFKHHADELETRDIDKYYSRHDWPAFMVPPYYSQFFFTVKEIEYGEARLKELGLRRPYICLAARSAQYNLTTLKNASGMEYEYSYRHMDFNDYDSTIRLLESMGFQAVRVGRDKPLQTEYKNLIDYVGLQGDEFMDLYILANAHAMILNSFGIWSMASLFGVPLLMVNHMPYSCGYGGARYTAKDLYLPKKYYSRKEKRFLSLKEMADVEAECIYSWSSYQQLGLDYIQNTPEEIRDAAEEFILRLKGGWTADAEEEKLLKRFDRIMEEVRKNTAENELMTTGCPVPSRICTGFLKKNPYLLS